MLADLVRHSAQPEPLVHYFSVARDFTRTPGAAKRAEHATPGYSGEELRAQLVPLLRCCEARPDNPRPRLAVVVELGGVAGYSGSFLEEAFGRLVSTEGFSASFLESKLLLFDRDESTEGPFEGQHYAEQIRDAIQENQYWVDEEVVVFTGPFENQAKLGFLVKPTADIDLVVDAAFLTQWGFTQVYRGSRQEANRWMGENPLESLTRIYLSIDTLIT